MTTSEDPGSRLRSEYQRRMLEMRAAFDAGATGAATIAARAQAMDELISAVWRTAVEDLPALGTGIALLAVGGYGRRELFPFSDVDLLFILDARTSEKDVRHPIRRVSQELWDCGVRLSPVTRKASECERYASENAEFALALLDHRLLTGDATVYARLAGATLPKMLERDHKAIRSALVELTTERHKKYGNTLFHLEPNIKDCPGGLRDVHVCGWLAMLDAVNGRAGKAPALAAPAVAAGDEFLQAVEFLSTVRCFLHYRHQRDDNTLDWQAQDAAARELIGLDRRRSNRPAEGADAAYWMRLYFRHARSVERRLSQMLEDSAAPRPRKLAVLKTRNPKARTGFTIESGRAVLAANAGAAIDPAHDPDIVLQLFAAMARTPCTLERTTEERLSHALPLLSAHLEEGPALWHHLREILLGRYAGNTLRTMHALGILELLIPEFHGIDALVVRDAYHRYTVDEHTFVVIDTLHSLETGKKGPLHEWAARFGTLLRDLQHAPLLYLVALMHDTGKGRSTAAHANESARLARSLLERLELDAYETDIVAGLIQNHVEMSAALRRDIFDNETVRAFAGKIQTPEALRMLTLFTYADINAVHPDALTPWKAENLWRLYLATSNYLDRSVDDERVGARATNELVRRVVALLPGRKAEVQAYLEGFPERYLRTRSPEQVRTHFEMASRFAEDPVQLDFHHALSASEITVVTPDRPLLFADMAGALAAWGMNIVTADAFSNRQGVVVDSFRFTDSYRTLEMNQSEHGEFVASVHAVMTGAISVEKLLQGKRRGRGKPPNLRVETRISFDDDASAHSTLVQVVAQDVPGLLRAISLALGRRGCNIEVALVDTEGETAIDVFYVTSNGAKLDPAGQQALRTELLEAMEANAA